MKRVPMKRLQTAFFFYLIFLLGITIAMMGPSLRLLADQTGVGLSEISTIVLIMPVGFITGIYICRHFLNSAYIKHVLFLSLLFFIVLMLFAPLSSIFLLACTLFLLIAITQGVYEVAANVFIVDLYKDNPAPYLNAMHFCFGLGAMLAPALIGYNIEYFNSLVHSYYFFAAVGVVALVWLLFLPLKPVLDDDSEELKQSRDKNYLKILVAIHVFFFVYIFLEVGYSLSIFPYLREGGLLDAGSSGLFTSLFWLVFTLFRLFGIALSMRFNALKIMLAHSIVGLVGLPMIIFAAADQTWLLWLGNIIVGASLSIFFPCILSYCETGFKIPSKSVSHFFVSATVGAMFSSWFVVQLLAIEPKFALYPLVLCTIFIPFVILYLGRFKSNAQKTAPSVTQAK